MTRDEFARELIEAIGAKHCDRNAHALVAWMQAEGGSARWNPLNTTQKMTGSTDYNDLPGDIAVQEYLTAEDGVEATRRTILQDDPDLGYSKIVSRLRRCAPARRTLSAVEGSDWGTGGLALRCLSEVAASYWHFGNMRIAGT